MEALTTATPELLTVREACARLRVSRPTLDALMDEGALTRLKVRRSVRLRASDVDAYLDRCEQDGRR